MYRCLQKLRKKKVIREGTGHDDGEGSLKHVLSIFWGDIFEQVSHGFVVLCTSNGLCKENADIYGLDLGAALNLHRNGIGEHDFVDFTLLKPTMRLFVVTEDKAMRSDDVDLRKNK